MAKMEVGIVNALDFEEFTSKFGNVIEHCPVLGAAVYSKKPFRGLDDIRQAFFELIDELPVEVRTGILRCHPDLAGKLASTGLLTAESTREQSHAGLHLLTEDEKVTLKQNNSEYKKKFGFPFIICVRQNKKEAILRCIVERLANSPEHELQTGIEEVKKIAHLRLCDLVAGEQSIEV